MPIEKIRIKNFFTHKDTELDIKPLTVFTGMNSSGKTNIFRTLLLWKELAYIENIGQRGSALKEINDNWVPLTLPEDRRAVLWTDGKETAEDAWLIVEGKFSPNEYKISTEKWDNTTFGFKSTLKYTEKEYSGFFEIKNIPEENQSGSGKKYSVSITGKYDTNKYRPLFSYRTGDTGLGLPGNSGVLLYNTLLNHINYYYCGVPTLKRENIMLQEFPVDDTEDFFILKNNELFTTLYYNSEEYIPRINEYLETVFGEWKDIYNLPIKFNLKLVPGRRIVPIIAFGRDMKVRDTELSTGIYKVLNLIIRIALTVGPSCILIDEPELHIEPDRQRFLIGLFYKIYRETGTQFVISTHSEHIIDAISVLIYNGNLDPNDCAIYHFETERFVSKVKPIKIGKNGSIGRIPVFYKAALREFEELPPPSPDRSGDS